MANLFILFDFVVVGVRARPTPAAASANVHDNRECELAVQCELWLSFELHAFCLEFTILRRFFECNYSDATLKLEKRNFKRISDRF